MCDATGSAHRLHPEALLHSLEAVPKRFATPQNDGHHSDVQVIDQVGCQKLADGRRTAADADIQIAGGLLRGVKCLGRAGIDEVEGGTTLHHYGRPGVMSEHEDRGVKWRVVAPPTFPVVVSPWPALGSELVAPHDFRADP